MTKLSPSARLALLYFLFSSLWIIAGDRIVFAFSSDPAVIAQIQSVKGLFFVIACTGGIYLFSHKYYLDINRSLQKSDLLLAKYQALNEASKEGIVDYDLKNGVATINEQLKHFTGTSQSFIPAFGDFHDQLIHPEDRERISQSFEETVACGSPFWQAEYRCLWHDGTYHDVIHKGSIIRDHASGEPVSFIGAIQDVTELRDAQARLYEHQLKARLQLGRMIIKAQEEERNRWATELHDNVCQMLTVVKLYLAEIANGRALPPSLAQQPQALVEKALNEIRHLSAAIRPPEFETLTLSEALDLLISSIKRVKPYEFHLNLAKLDEEQLSVQHKLMVYRVVQEAVSNILKYANPQNIYLTISSSENLVTLEIEDDGAGFDPNQLAGGIGLRNIQGRLQVFSGFLRIDSAPGKGCKLYGQFSLT